MKWIRDSGKGLVAVCIGNELRCDDIVGLYFCRELSARCGSKIRNIECPGGLELCTHRLSEMKPRKLLIVDSVMANLEPGSIVFTCDINDIVSFEPISTHYLPLDEVIRYVKEMTNSIEEVCLLGIQVTCLDLGEKPDKRVMRAAQRMVEIICNRI